MWMQREGILDSVRDGLARRGTDLGRELPDLFVSDDLHAALLEARPGLAADVHGAGDRLIAQYPEVQDVSNDEMIPFRGADVQQAVLTLRPQPILDEVQQFIGQSGEADWPATVWPDWVRDAAPTTSHPRPVQH